MIIDTASRLKGTKEYYFAVKLREIRTMQAEGKDVINMGVGNPDLSPSSNTIDTLCDAAREPGNHGYQPYRGIPELRETIAAWYHDIYKVSLDPATEILPLIGSKEGITHISLTFLDPGDEVLVPELGYPAYTAVTKMLGGNARPYPLLEDNNWEPDFQAMEQMDCSKVKLMWVNYPHMPTGTPPHKNLFEKLVNFAREKQVLLCHDNPYSLILNEDDPLSLLSIEGAKEVCLELNSLSKSHNMAGWRVGWICGAQDYLDQIIKIKSNIDSGMFKPIQLAATEALQNTRPWHTSQNKIYIKRRKIVHEILDQMGCTYKPHQQGLFVWAKIPDNVSSAEEYVEDILHQKNVFFTPGFIFGEKGNRHIRVSLCNDENTLYQVLNRISLQ